MIRRLREMASQILSPQSEGKRFFEAVASEIENLGAFHDTVRWIASQENLFFAECSQAEEIVARCKVALKNTDPNADPSYQNGQHFYFVDGEKFDCERCTTGAAIKSRLPDAKRKSVLYLEQNPGPDILADDDLSFDLRDCKRFFTVPPANFGV